MDILLSVDDAGTVHFMNGEKEVMTMAEAPDEKTGRFLITLSGKMIHDAVPGFSDEVTALISMGEKITLNLEGLTDICGEGINELVQIQRQIDQRNKNEVLLLTAVPEKVWNSMKAIGATDLLAIQDKRGEKK